MIPNVGGFGVIYPGTGQKTNSKILGFAVKTAKTKLGLRAERFEKKVPLIGIEVEFLSDRAVFESFEKQGTFGVVIAGEAVKFVPFDLIGQKKIDQIVDIGNGGSENSHNFLIGVKMDGATTSQRGNFWPGDDIWEAGIGEDFGSLADKDFFGFVDLGRKTLDTVDEGGKVNLVGLGTKWMKERLGFEMVVLEGVDSNLEGAFEGGAVGANVEIDTFDSGH